MAASDGATMSTADRTTPRKLAALLRAQMRNIAPFLTLIFLSAFFAAGQCR
jgi:ribose transport system permease protein